MSLPTEKSKIVESLADYIILVYGRPKIGKSPFCNNFPNALFLATEPRLKHIECYKTDIHNWPDFLNTCGDIAGGKHEYKTIIIDTVDLLVAQCSEYVCKKYQMEYPGDMPMGKGWYLVTSELKRALTKLASLPYGLVMVSHSKQETIETPTKKFNRWTINIGGKNGDVVLDMVDIILFMDSAVKDKKEVGLIRTKSSAHWEGGDGTKRLPTTIEYPIDKPEIAYKQIVEAFKGK